jgi:hypothetical protein
MKDGEGRIEAKGYGETRTIRNPYYRMFSDNGEPLYKTGVFPEDDTKRYTRSQYMGIAKSGSVG